MGQGPVRWNWHFGNVSSRFKKVFGYGWQVCESARQAPWRIDELCYARLKHRNRLFTQVSPGRLRSGYSRCGCGVCHIISLCVSMLGLGVTYLHEKYGYKVSCD